MGVELGEARRLVEDATDADPEVGFAAVVAGSRSFTAIGEWVADAPPSVLASLGIGRDP